MPHIILKKTFKTKPAGFQVANEKSLSFHGSSLTSAMIQVINGRLSTIQYRGKAQKVQFGILTLHSGQTQGNYICEMNHDCQKYNEEDVVCTILDCMEEMGYNFRFQYDQEIDSGRLDGASSTKRECFLFHKAM